MEVHLPDLDTADTFSRGHTVLCVLYFSACSLLSPCDDVMAKVVAMVITLVIGMVCFHISFSFLKLN